MSCVVGTKVREMLKKHGCMCAGDFMDALDEVVAWHVGKAAERAKANGRKTARGSDL